MAATVERIPDRCGTSPSRVGIADGEIVSVEQPGDDLVVVVDLAGGGSLPDRPAIRQRLALTFHGVEDIIANHPERMMFATLTETPAPPLLRHFEFANWFQPGDDWNPYLAACQLEITARDLTIEEMPPTVL